MLQIPNPDAVARPRRDAIDLVRGLVMVIMALDHVRDYFGASVSNPRDVNDAAVFLTRWITHFCAPTFVLLAGAGAFLYGRKGRSRGQVSRFLVTRGLWLVLLELTVVRLAWTFDVVPGVVFLQVIWAIGWSMVALAALVHLPRWAIAAIGLALIAGHNALDGVHAGAFGGAGWLWSFLHERAIFGAGAAAAAGPPGRAMPGLIVVLSYPLVPWIGVMAVGYALGALFEREAGERRKRLVAMGLAAIIVFVTLRALGIYGDPAPRVAGASLGASILSFLNCEKYPPSLLYLGMTLGPALLLLAAAEGTDGRGRGPIARWLVGLGRVPMLFYVVHLLLIHALAVVYAAVATGKTGWLFEGLPIRGKPPGYGLTLLGVYGVWLLVVLALTPLCRWFAALKQRRSDWWLSYL